MMSTHVNLGVGRKNACSTWSIFTVGRVHASGGVPLDMLCLLACGHMLLRRLERREDDPQRTVVCSCATKNVGLSNTGTDLSRRTL